jgi:transcriptional regulator with XRE-family HTH domain
MKKVVEFDYSNLLGQLKKNGITQEEFALYIGTNPSTLSLKLNNKAYFKQLEMDKAREMLGFSESEVGAYFFCRRSLEN